MDALVAACFIFQSSGLGNLSADIKSFSIVIDLTVKNGPIVIISSLK